MQGCVASDGKELEWEIICTYNFTNEVFLKVVPLFKCKTWVVIYLYFFPEMKCYVYIAVPLSSIIVIVLFTVISYFLFSLFIFSPPRSSYPLNTFLPFFLTVSYFYFKLPFYFLVSFSIFASFCVLSVRIPIFSVPFSRSSLLPSVLLKLCDHNLS
jgi:hypothetical protein